MHIAADDTLIYHFNEEIEEDSEQRFEKHNTLYIDSNKLSKNLKEKQAEEENENKEKSASL